MMIYSGVKLVEIPLDKGKGRYYLPDDRTLFDKKIQAIVPMFGIEPLVYNGSILDNYRQIALGSSQLSNCYINLTDNGQNYFYRNNMFAMSNFSCLGKFDSIDKVLSIPNCYIDVDFYFSAEGTSIPTIQLVVFYENRIAINASRDSNYNYERFDVAVSETAREKSFFGDNRILVKKRFRNLMTNYSLDLYNAETGFAAPIEQCGYITLVNGGEYIWENMPIYLINQLYYYEKLQFANFEFDFNNSYIETSQTLPEPTTVTFTAEYER